MSETTDSESEASFASSAVRPLLMFFLAAFAGLALLMWGLQVLAGLVGSSTGSAKAIDFENNSITIYLRQEPPQLDNTRATDSVSGIVLGHSMEGLTRMDLQDRLEPGIAERWEVTTEKATFWLRKNAKWSDGSTITAHDFVFGWKTVLDPNTASRYAFLLYPIKNARAVNEGNLPLDDVGIRALDDFTLEVELENPTPFFDKMMTFQTYYPVQEKFYKSTDGKFGAEADKLLSSGPFIVKEWVHGASILLERNPHYWDQQRIHLDSINFGYITSDQTALLNFFKDDKIAYTTLNAENLRDAMENHWHVSREQDGTIWYMEFNHRPERLTSNHNLRRAIQLVMNMEELVYKVIKLSGNLPGESLFPVWLTGVNDYFRKEYPAPKIRLDEALAREHLAKAKEELGLDEWPELVLLADDTPQSSLQAEWVQGTLKSKLGLTIKIDKQIFKQRLEKSLAGQFDLLNAGWGPDYDDPLTYGDLFASWNVQNRGRYANPELDEQVAISQNSIDPKTRMDAFDRIQRILIEDAAILPNYERGVSYVVKPELKNVKRRVIGAEVDFTNAYLEKEG